MADRRSFTLDEARSFGAEIGIDWATAPFWTRRRQPADQSKAPRAVLRIPGLPGTMELWRIRKPHSSFWTLFGIRAEVHDIHVAMFGEDDEEETEDDS